MSATVELDAFWAALGRARDGLRSDDACVQTVRGLWDAARAAHPEVTVDAGRFLAHWGGHLGRTPDPVKALTQLHVGDLYLAFACAEGDAAALRILKDRILPGLVPAIRSLQASPTFVDEIQQQLLERLLVSASGQPARIAEYAGRGSLTHWLHAVAVRLSLNALRSQKRAPEIPGGDGLLEVVAPASDPALALLRRRYGPELSQALRRAIAQLTRQQRNLLKLHFVDGLSLNQVGGVYQTHKSTVSRWIAQAREEVLTRTRDDLRERLGIVPGELESLMQAMGSQLELSLSTVLRS